MDVCVVFIVRTVAWNVKWHEGQKDLNNTKMDQRGKPRTDKKKSHRGHGCLCFVCCIRTVAWNVKWHEGRKDLKNTKMDQRGKTPDRQKKITPAGWRDFFSSHKSQTPFSLDGYWGRGKAAGAWS
jgi:hypothetical protein